MAQSPTRLADVLALAKTMTPLDRVRLVEQVMVSLEQDMEPTPPRPTDALGWPVGYFEALDAIEADDMLERPPQGIVEQREPLE